jgi:hypothetical protein
LEIEFTTRGCTAYVGGVEKRHVPIAEYGPWVDAAFTRDVKVYAAENRYGRGPPAKASVRNLRIDIGRHYWPESMRADSSNHNSSLPEAGEEGGAGAAQTCWAGLRVLVPRAHSLAGTNDGAVSSQGADYFTERLCTGWHKFVQADACSESEPDCDTAGSSIYDGGDDMYDIGEGISDLIRAFCRFHSIVGSQCIILQGT